MFFFLYSIYAVDSAPATWAILKRYFVNTTTAREMQIKYQLQSLKKGDLFIDAYMGKIKELADSLQAIDHVLADFELLIYALNGLPQSYESIVTMASNQIPPPPYYSQNFGVNFKHKKHVLNSFMVS